MDAAKPLLRKAIQISQQTPYWHCRLLFQLAVSTGASETLRHELKCQSHRLSLGGLLATIEGQAALLCQSPLSCILSTSFSQGYLGDPLLVLPALDLAICHVPCLL